MRKSNYEEIKKKVESQGSKLLDTEYKNNTTKLNMICKCGKHFEKTYKIMSRSKLYICNDCIKEKQDKEKIIPFNKIKEQLDEINMDILIDEEDYKGLEHKYYFKCKTEGHITNSWLRDVLNSNKGCKKCHHIQMGKNQMLSYKEVVDMYDEINYKVLTSEKEYYEEANGKILVLCDKGHIHFSNIMNFKHNEVRCPICFEERRRKTSIISYEERVKQIENEGYKMKTSKEEYVNGDTEIILVCNHGHEYITTMHSFITGTRCPYCNMSKGEIKIEEILLKYNINDYIFQYRFEKCKHIRTLPFDFYIPSLNTVIEYDGKQHFKYGCFNMTLLDLMNLKHRDNIKTRYCNDNNIKLIRVPYWDYKNIEEILVKELKLK